MAWQQSDLTALEASIKTGTKSVSYGDRRVEYHSLGEMLLLRDQMRAEIAASTQGGVVYAGRVE